MPVKPTSAVAYKKLKDSGKLSIMRQHAYDGLVAYIAKYGTLPTAYELFKEMRGDGLVNDLNDVRPKLTELKDRSRVYNPAGKRLCTVTNHSVMVWDVVRAGVAVDAKKPRQKKPREPREQSLF